MQLGVRSQGYIVFPRASTPFREDQQHNLASKIFQG